jgi:FAD/FMN-containing dehydrogenase
MHPSTTASPSAAARIAGAVTGRVIAPGDAEYDEARRVFSGEFDRRPALIVRAADVHDVQRVVTLARETGVELAIRSGGHSGAGHSTTEGGIVLDLRDQSGIEIDVAGRTAWAQSGMTAIDVSKAIAAHGLALGFGDTGSVGIGGITTGGGIGYLTRKYGLTIDSLLAAEVVTADGELHHVDAEHEPDLFWAIRGGGGNFGVVTRFHFRLHPLDRIVGGMLMLPATPEIVAGFIAASEAGPEELSTIANVMPAMPMPFVPAEHHGKLVIFGLVCYAGPADAGERAIAPLRALATPIVDMVRPIPYPEIFPPEDPSYRPTAVGRTMFVDRVDLETARTIDRYLRASNASVRVAQIRVLGGAAARVPVDATAYAHRKSRILVNLAAFYDGPDDRAVRYAWVEEFAAALRQTDQGAYVNFLSDERPELVRAAYPGATWDRLAAIKRRYDPTNLFRLNQNIPPSA